jgi:hypothetical protein
MAEERILSIFSRGRASFHDLQSEEGFVSGRGYSGWIRRTGPVEMAAT